MDRLPDVMLDHRIQQRAYEIHQSKADGSPLEDWLQAERQVLQEISYARDGLRRATGTRKLNEANRAGRENRQMQRFR